MESECLKKRYIFGIMIGMIINCANILLGMIRQYEYDSLKAEGYRFECPWSVYNIFILCNTDTAVTKIYLFCIPIITSIVVYNVSQKRTVRSLFKSFYVGFIVTCFTLGCSLLLTVFTFPVINPEVSTGYFPLGYRGCIFNNIYNSCPALYIIIFVILFSVYSGLFAVISHGINIIFKSILSVIFISCLVNICISNFLVEFGLMESAPVYLLIPSETFFGADLNDYLIYILVWGIVTTIILLIGCSDLIFRKKDKT